MYESWSLRFAMAQWCLSGGTSPQSPLHPQPGMILGHQASNKKALGQAIASARGCEERRSIGEPVRVDSNALSSSRSLSDQFETSEGSGRCEERSREGNWGDVEEEWSEAG